MKKPTSVTILGQEIKIYYLDELPEKCRGLYNQYDHFIMIEKGPEWRDHLLHELLHAALQLSKANIKMSLKKEESLVEKLEESLRDILMVNRRSKFVKN
jgi:hypothetical protein